jgi:hypothetical protein
MGIRNRSPSFSSPSSNRGERSVGVTECWSFDLFARIGFSTAGRDSTRHLKPSPEANLPGDHSRGRGQGQVASARIHIGQEIINGWLRRSLGFLNSTLNLIVDFLVDTIEIIQVRITAH